MVNVTTMNSASVREFAPALVDEADEANQKKTMMQDLKVVDTVEIEEIIEQNSVAQTEETVEQKSEIVVDLHGESSTPQKMGVPETVGDVSSIAADDSQGEGDSQGE